MTLSLIAHRSQDILWNFKFLWA